MDKEKNTINIDKINATNSANEHRIKQKTIEVEQEFLGTLIERYQYSRVKEIFNDIIDKLKLSFDKEGNSAFDILGNNIGIEELLNYLLDGVETYVADTLTYVLSYSYEERSQHEATTIGNILLKGVLSEIETDIMVGTSSNPDCENIGLRHSSINEGITVTEILGNSLEKLENSFNDYILDTPIKNV